MSLNIKGYLFELFSLHLFNGPLWFLIVMFLSETAFLILCMIFNGLEKIGYILLGMLFGVLMFLPKFQAYINVTTVIMGLFFLLVGYLLFDFFIKRSIPFVIATLIVTISVSIINKGVGMPDYQDGYRVLFMLGAITGCDFILQISQLLQRLNDQLLNFYGKNSLILLGTHYPILCVFKGFLHINEFSVFEGVYFLVILLFVEIPVIYMINNYLPIVIGKKYFGKEKVI